MVSLFWWRWRSNAGNLRSKKTVWNTCTRMAERQTSHGGRGNCYSSSVLSLEQWLLSMEEQHQRSQLWRFLCVRAPSTSDLPLTVLWGKKSSWWVYSSRRMSLSYVILNLSPQNNLYLWLDQIPTSKVFARVSAKVVSIPFFEDLCVIYRPGGPYGEKCAWGLDHTPDRGCRPRSVFKT